MPKGHATIPVYQVLLGTICYYYYYETYDGSCGLSHSINFSKLDRGICYHEFDEKDSCTWGDNCNFCHDLPEIARSDPNVKKTVEESKQRKRQKPRRRNRTEQKSCKWE